MSTISKNIALYRTEYGGLTVWEHSEVSHAPDGWVRVSEPVMVEFTFRLETDVIPEQLAVLDAEKSKIVSHYESQLASIADRRAKLLAITGPAS